MLPQFNFKSSLLRRLQPHISICIQRWLFRLPVLLLTYRSYSAILTCSKRKQNNQWFCSMLNKVQLNSNLNTGSRMHKCRSGKRTIIIMKRSYGYRRICDRVWHNFPRHYEQSLSCIDKCFPRSNTLRHQEDSRHTWMVQCRTPRSKRHIRRIFRFYHIQLDTRSAECKLHFHCARGQIRRCMRRCNL